MSVTAPGSLLDRVRRYTEESRQRDVLVSLDDRGAFELLVAEVASCVLEDDAQDLTLLVDSATANHALALDPNSPEALQAFARAREARGRQLLGAGQVNVTHT